MNAPEKIDVTETPYLYAERTCSMDPSAIRESMGSAFREVWDYMQAAAILPAGPAISVYSGYDEVRLTFRAGFVLVPNDTLKADDDIRADVTPACTALHTVHIGPYDRLSETWGELMAHVEKLGLKAGWPCWEIYTDDPDTTPPAELHTELYLPIT